MPFPESERVIYRKNPLAEVICQFRFPTILRIDTEAPATFQERIRERYPLYTHEASASNLGFPEVLPPEIEQLVRHNLPAGHQTAHKFADTEGVWETTLAAGFLALKTTRYERWEEFSDRLESIFDALAAEYRPAFLTRVGLRYVDVIQKSKINLDASTPWSELLHPSIAGELGDVAIVNEIELARRELRLKLGDSSRAMIRHGVSFAPETKEQCFIVDSDFYAEGRTENDDAMAILRRFNREAGRLFRWCIAERLHEALEPEPVGS